MRQDCIGLGSGCTEWADYLRCCWGGAQHCKECAAIRLATSAQVPEALKAAVRLIIPTKRGVSWLKAWPTRVEGIVDPEHVDVSVRDRVYEK
eukprot:5065933-Amphidinium_carterae.1